MASRYRYNKTIKSKDTKRSYYESTIYPKITPKDSDIYIISDSSDRLDLLANKYYNDSSLWWIIAVANNLNDANFFIEPGKQIRIPTNITDVLNNLSKLNS